MEIQDKNLSPVMALYVNLKKEYNDAILLFRLGDFYEIFFNDAIIASKVLDLVLTKRGKTENNDIPMCGVPFHASDNYIARLVKAGYKVAICEQMETPEQAKLRGAKQIKREIIRVITPGTIVDENLLNPDQNNYLCAIYKHSLACFDLSTNDFRVFDYKDDNLSDYLNKLNPSEILILEQFSEENWVKNLSNRKLYFINEKFIIKSNLKNDLGLDDNFSDNDSIVVAMIKHYLDKTIMDFNFKPAKIKKETFDKKLQIDISTWKSLEIDNSIFGDKNMCLLSVIDKTETAGGSRKLKQNLLNLSTDLDLIESRQNKIKTFINDKNLMSDFISLLKKTPDLERSLSRILSGKTMPRDLKSVSDFISLTPKFLVLLKHFNDIKCEELKTFDSLSLDLEKGLSDSLPATFRDTGIIANGYSDILDNFRNMSSNSHQMILNLQEEYIKRTNANNLKIKYNNIFGYFIDVPPKQAENLTSDNEFIHRQTLVSGLRFTTHKLSELENDIRSSQDKATAIEKDIINEFIEKIKSISDDLQIWADLISDFDFIISLAKVALSDNWVCPEMTYDKTFDVINGRHPVVEKFLSDNYKNFIANDCILTDKNIWLITGPNMAGKSTFLRQNAIIIVLAHLGSFVPADSAKIGIVDKLFSRVGASDNLASGQSTFMVEMLETAKILNEATENSFIILDELGRGTSTWDGLSIAWSVLEYLNKLNARILFATHYHKLTVLEESKSHIENHTIDITEYNSEIIFKHKLIKGVANKSYGIYVAKMAGVPDNIIHKANQVLSNLENSDKKDLKQLNLFEMPIIQSNPNEKIIKKLKEINLNNMTPIEALNVLSTILSELK